MATGTYSNSAQATTPRDLTVEGLFWQVMKFAGSLKITVSMLALAIVIILIGTLAQDEESIIDVKRNYFNAWIAFVDCDVFMPQTLLPHEKPLNIPFVMPGGALVGLILMVNLFAAKLTRFSMNARGGQLTIGLIIVAIGAALFSLVVFTAHATDGVQGEVPIDYGALWWIVKSCIWATAALITSWLVIFTPKRFLVRVVAGVLASLFIIWGVALIFPNAESAIRIPDPGLRIVWQLGKGLVVGLILLLGLSILFGKRGGNVLIHIAVALLMVGQFMFGDRQIEERMTIIEGDTTNETYVIDAPELAVIDRSDPDADKIVAFDSQVLQSTDQYVSHDSLPLEFKLVQWQRNSELVEPTDENIATDGIGLQVETRPLKPVGGASQKTNLASMYVKVRDKTSNRDIGTYLISQLLTDDQITTRPRIDTVLVGEREFDLVLRFRRNYKPYFVKLNDVQRIDYSGTATPQDFSSEIELSSGEGKELPSGRVWMNNPLRFQGETFYQSGYLSAAESPDGKETTTLQIVKNAGWLVPYMACVLAAIGMLSHFGITFVRFAGRYDREQAKANADEPSVVQDESNLNANQPRPAFIRKGSFGWMGVVSALLGMGLVGTIVVYSFLPKKYDVNEFDYRTAGEIPVWYNGRITPLNVAAEHLTLTLRTRRTALKPDGERVSATQWLLAIMSKQKWPDESRMIRIDAKNVLDLLHLERRTAAPDAPDEVRELNEATRNLYSFKEISEHRAELEEAFRRLPRDSEKWEEGDAKIAHATRKIRLYEMLTFGYQPFLPRSNEETMQLESMMSFLAQQNIPGIIPPVATDFNKFTEDELPRKWLAFGPAIVAKIQAGRKDPDSKEVDSDSSPLTVFIKMMTAYRESDAARFNGLTEKFLATVAQHPVEGGKVEKVKFEARYEASRLVNIATYLYVAIFVITLLSYITFASSKTVSVGRRIQSFAFWMMLGTLLAHTAVIVCRVIISERPPVVNLYSSAVFIGWAMVLVCIVSEWLFPMGLASLVGSLAGFLTLLVAYGLDDGNSMPVLQAVLDTQFWLATHVVCITLGYAATFVAGFVGILILGALFAKNIAKNKIGASSVADVLYRICYGSVCFALFLSFVGTVLGGLWGDDSWGRFWGWDPKENGALMIVLWNAILLHARWDKIVGARGFALLAIGGNIVTAWSYFGTNQLGIGLHSYGFTEAALSNLIIFILSQVGIILAGALLTSRLLFIDKGTGTEKAI